ncbi:efflux RND transporter periplasmic adaptor subunit [Rhizobium paknamense]|uniref:HlyD family secretion protein n=1 Tax=Rhizobium paknamense TaxID=1206817 RepID=A0ABU0IIY1_9HYPH|nr:efflux RND transporter periplasmic adaptor subunit [Rhizobium paknamense]MDQ0457164.1 HlyD family secretion protein [Rhizobium paknamense]
MRTFVFLAATGLLFSLSLERGQAADPAPAATEARLPAIVVTETMKRHLTERVLATGTIRAVEELYVAPEVDGLQVQSLLADVGDHVTAGQVLATLNGDSLKLQKAQLLANKARAEASLTQGRIQLTDAEASALEAERQLKRGQALVTGGTISTSQLQQQETSAINARNRVETARQAIAIAEAELKAVDSQIDDIDLKLARTEVKAPYGGVVTARNARIGAIATGAGQPLFTLIREGQLELVADVSETDIAKMKTGQRADVTIPGRLEPLTGHIRLISPAIDQTTRLGAVHVELDDDGVARQGMYGSASIAVSAVDGLALPLSAVNTGKHGASVRVVRDGVVHQVTVKTGIEENGFLEIAEGLQAGDMVVAKAGAFVRDGDRIRPVREDVTASN